MARQMQIFSDDNTQLEILTPLGKVDSIAARSEALKRFAKAKAFKFPISYAYFIRKYGPGEVNRFARIFAPQSERDCLLSMDSLWNELIEFESCEFFGTNLVPFARSVGGEVFFWKATTRRADGEMPVYVSGRSQSDPRLFAKSFFGFFRAVCEGKKLEICRSYTFQPYGSLPNGKTSQRASDEEIERRKELAKKWRV
jgi:hypothetical protein